MRMIESYMLYDNQGEIERRAEGRAQGSIEWGLKQIDAGADAIALLCD